MDNEEELPQHVIEGIKRALQEAKEGKVYPFTSIEDMLWDKDGNKKERHRSEGDVKGNPYFRRNK